MRPLLATAIFAVGCSFALVALKGGEPSSVTMVVKVLVLGPWASLGVQEIIPFAEMIALVGATRRV